MRTFYVLFALTFGCSENVIDKLTDTGGYIPPAPIDADDDGYNEDDDCNDSDASVHPDADELCDGIDNDCDDEIDEDAIDMTTWFGDSDGDGYGNPAEEAWVTACDMPEGYTDASMATDCDDLNEWIYPGADEFCDGIDNDCDEDIDEDAVDSTTWYVDTDGDGYGDSADATTVAACDMPDGYTDVELATDCNDSDETIYPEAPELCDELDNDCDDEVDEGSACSDGETLGVPSDVGDAVLDFRCNEWDETDEALCIQPQVRIPEGECDAHEASGTWVDTLYTNSPETRICPSFCQGMTGDASYTRCEGVTSGEETATYSAYGWSIGTDPFTSSECSSSAYRWWTDTLDYVESTPWTRTITVSTGYGGSEQLHVACSAW